MFVRRLVAAGIVVLLGALPASAVDFGDGVVRLKTVQYSAADGPGPAARDPRAEPQPDVACAWIVAFEPPSDAALVANLEAAGARLHGYLPSNAYLVRATGDTAAALERVPGVLRVDRLRAEWKISPDLGRIEWRTDERRAVAPDLLLVVHAFDDAPEADAVRAMNAAGARILSVGSDASGRRLVVRATDDAVARIAEDPAVVWIEEVGELELRNDAARWVIQSNVNGVTPLHEQGLFGEGEIVGHIDAQISMGSCYFSDTDDNTPGPDHRKVVAYRSSTGLGANSHGTHTAGTVAGDREPVDGSLLQRGMAPKARISHTNFFDIDGFGDSPSNLLAMLNAAHADGARVHTNSWGETSVGTYTTWSVDVDTFARANEEDLVIFAIANVGDVIAPENSKNCLAVGRTNRAPNQHQQAGSNASGPTFDGRRKPDVLAPGTSTVSASTTGCSTVSMTGTSMSAPAVAGGAVLVREYFTSGFYPSGAPRASDAYVPTGALLKAAVINSAVDLTGVFGYPTDLEGWGRILLDDALYFAGDARRLWLRDVRHAEGLATGEVDTYRVRVAGLAQPLKVSLVFTDQPALHLADPAPVNDLDLEVEGPDGLFLGNVFDVLAGTSMGGGAADPLNNVERVVRILPTPGTWTIRVRGADVPMGPQGYALVVNGDLFHVSHQVDLADLGSAQEARRPLTFELHAPSPTPFQSTTTLRWAQPNAGVVQLAVFDVTGRRVRTLVDRTVDAGEFTTSWDGRDDAGARVAPGIYFVRLSATGVPGAERVRRTVLLR